MQLQETLKLKKKFDPNLRSGDYSFIGPNDENLLSEFILRANEIGPYDFFSTTYRMPLEDEDTIIKVIRMYPDDTLFRIYIVLGEVEKSGLLIHSTIEDYCSRFHIDFDHQ